MIDDHDIQRTKSAENFIKFVICKNKQFLKDKTVLVNDKGMHRLNLLLLSHISINSINLSWEFFLKLRKCRALRSKVKTDLRN